MYPWLWFWAPQFHYPLGGNVVQDIDPVLSLFFAGIKPQAGNAVIERQAFDVASYGKQLGLITEILLAMADPKHADAASVKSSIGELESIRDEIEKLKDLEYKREADEIKCRIEKIMAKGGRPAVELKAALRSMPRISQ